MEESKIDRIRRESAERRARGDYIPDPRETAVSEAREFIGKAKEFADRGINGDDANWATAYATLALATLALAKH